MDVTPLFDIFISYAGEDHDRIRPLKDVFETCGWTVFWDRTIPTNKAQQRTAAETLDAARCVFVAWSKNSIKSKLVLKEADTGHERKILVPILIDEVSPPPRFSVIETQNLTHLDLTQPSPELEKLKASIFRILSHTSSNTTGEASDPRQVVATSSVDHEVSLQAKPSHLNTVLDSDNSTQTGTITRKSKPWFGNTSLLLFRLVAFILMTLGAWYVWEQYNFASQQKQQRQIVKHELEKGGSISAEQPAKSEIANDVSVATQPNNSTLSTASNLYLTAKESNGIPLNKPSTQFSCTDKIFAIIEVVGLPQKKHELIAVWRDPHGKDRERTRYPFFSTADSNRIWVWLKLHRPPEASLVRFINPSAGMEEFIGEWELSVTLNGKLLKKQTFNVLC